MKQQEYFLRFQFGLWYLIPWTIDVMFTFDANVLEPMEFGEVWEEWLLTEEDSGLTLFMEVDE